MSLPKPPSYAADLLTPAEVAAMFGVSTTVVARWANSRKLTSVKTLGGHHRFRAAEVQALRAGLTTEADPDRA